MNKIQFLAAMQEYFAQNRFEPDMVWEEIFPKFESIIASERIRVAKMQQFDLEFNDPIGVDEAGRGAFAGPVAAAAVHFPKPIFIPFIDDSKKLTPEVRAVLATLITASADSAVAFSSPTEIDHLNILNATLNAMRDAVEQLSINGYVIVDGNKTISGLNLPQAAVVKGDSLSFSVAAASILTKHTRDQLISSYDEKYPEYRFSEHKGYGTQIHRDAIKRYGIIDGIHRRSFVHFTKGEQLSLDLAYK